jgi:hypothetical protein
MCCYSVYNIEILPIIKQLSRFCPNIRSDVGVYDVFTLAKKAKSNISMHTVMLSEHVLFLLQCTWHSPYSGFAVNSLRRQVQLLLTTTIYWEVALSRLLELCLLVAGCFILRARKRRQYAPPKHQFYQTKMRHIAEDNKICACYWTTVHLATSTHNTLFHYLYLIQAS